MSYLGVSHDIALTLHKMATQYAPDGYGDVAMKGVWVDDESTCTSRLRHPIDASSRGRLPFAAPFVGQGTSEVSGKLCLAIACVVEETADSGETLTWLHILWLNPEVRQLPHTAHENELGTSTLRASMADGPEISARLFPMRNNIRIRRSRSTVVVRRIATTNCYYPSVVGSSPIWNSFCR